MNKEKQIKEMAEIIVSYGFKQLTKIKVYADYKRKSKFTKFIDKWYEPLVKKLQELKK